MIPNSFSRSILSQSQILLRKNPTNLDAFGQLGGVCYAVNLKEVKNRLRSVDSIQKITETMKMIASSRLRGAQRQIDISRPFQQSSQGPFEGEKKSLKKKNLIIVICTDRGLCGGINTVIVKTAKHIVEERTNEGIDVSAVMIGKRGIQQFSRLCPGKLVMTAIGTGKGLANFTGISALFEEIRKFNFDSISVVHTYFRNVMSQVPVVKDFETPKVMKSDSRNFYARYDYADIWNTELQDAFEYRLISYLYYASSECYVSELGSRMTSMESATKNASDLKKQLNLLFNRARQSLITTELIEITSGFLAQQKASEV